MTWAFFWSTGWKVLTYTKKREENIFKEETVSMVWGRVNLRWLQEIHMATRRQLGKNHYLQFS